MMTDFYSDIARNFPDKSNISIIGSYLKNGGIAKLNVKSYSRVFLIDDDALTNMLNKKIIQSINPTIPIITFLQIDDALAYLKEHDLKGDSLIFLDINFPQKNGWDFLEEYRQFELCSSVIMLSSSIDKIEKNKAREYEAVIDYVSKPLSFEYVEAIFNKVLK